MPCHHNVLESEHQDCSNESFQNKAAPNVSFYTPKQDVPAGAAANPQPDGSVPPKLFQALTLKGVTFQNRIMV